MLSINAPRRECPMNRTKCWGTPPGCTPIHILTPGVFAALKPLRLLSGDAFSVMHRAGCQLPRVSAHAVRLPWAMGFWAFSPNRLLLYLSGGSTVVGGLLLYLSGGSTVVGGLLLYLSGGSTMVGGLLLYLSEVF